MLLFFSIDKVFMAYVKRYLKFVLQNFQYVN